MSNFGFNTHWSRDALCQKAMNTILSARKNFIRVCAYQWLHSMIEESIFNSSKFAPKEYCVDNISDLSSKDSTIDTDSDYRARLERDKIDVNKVSPLLYRMSIRKSTTKSRENRITKMSIFNNLLSKRVRSVSNNLYDKPSILKLNATKSTLATLVEQSSPNPTSSHDIDDSFLGHTFTENVIKYDDVISRDSKDSKNNYSPENELLETTEPSRHLEVDGHFLSVLSALSVVARTSVAWSNDYINERPSQQFMQHFIAPTVQTNVSTLDIDNNNSKDDFVEKSTPSSKIEKNLILDVPKTISFGKDIFDLTESDEERETDSLNFKISV